MGVLIPSLKNNSISTDDHLEKLGMGPELLTPLRDERDQNGGFVQHVVPICPCLIPGWNLPWAPKGFYWKVKKDIVI